MVVNGVIMQDLFAQLLDKVHTVVCAVGAQCTQKANLVLLNACLQKLIQNGFCHNSGGVIKYDAHLFGISGQLFQSRTAIGSVKLLLDLLHGQGGGIIANDAVPLHLPAVRDIDFHRRKTLVSILLQCIFHFIFSISDAND